MNNIENLKKQYSEIKAPDSLRKNIEKIFEEDKKKQSKKIIKPLKITAAACFIASISFCTVLNVSPTFAKTVSDIPGFSDIVRVLTFNRYTFKDAGIEANVVTPKIEGLLNKDLENKLNEEFKENAEALILAFEADAKKLREQFPDEDVHMGMESSYTVRTDNENILAIDTYIFNTVGSSSTIHNFYNIDKKTGELLTLQGLFKEGADYITPISNYIKEEMLKTNKASDYVVYFTDFNNPDKLMFEEIQPDQKFFINDDGNLVICFDKYEVAPGATGSPEFVIPNDVIKDILK